MAQGLVTAARLTGEAQKLAAVVIGRPSEEEVNQRCKHLVRSETGRVLGKLATPAEP